MSSAASRAAEPAGTILLGVSGGIAAYKVAYVLRAFAKAGFDVHVLPTAESLNFVGAATWRELSGNHVTTSVFDESGPGHVELARRADLVVVAPATANTIAKIRAGIADDMLTTTIMASAAPMVLFPAMHTQMWLNPATQENIAVLEERGVIVVPPVSGDLSSGDSGPGRLPDPDHIAARALEVLESARRGEADEVTPEDDYLRGRHIVVTAGGNQEPIDPVRYVGNRSSGTQGVALAQTALDMGATVTLIHAAVSVPLPDPNPRLTIVSASTASSMYDAVMASLEQADALVMAAAVADFTPDTVSDAKIKKMPDTEELVVRLTRTKDILREVSTSENRPKALIGFGAETGTADEVASLGRRKAVAKGADLLAVNRVGDGLGFGRVHNTLTYFDASGNVVGEASGSKSQLAFDLLNRVESLLREKTLD